MTIARIIVITAAVCAAMGMTTQAEAAKRGRIPAGHIVLDGCAHWMPFCTFMGSGPGTYVLYGSATPVPTHTPISVLGRKTGPSNVGLCWGTQVQVIAWKPNPKIACAYR